MIESIRNFLHGKAHKQLMLIGLCATFSIFYTICFGVALYLQLWEVLWFKLAAAVVCLLLLVNYFRSRHTTTYVVLLIIMVEADIGSTLLSDEIFRFTTIYSFLLIFAFFFFFKLKNALIATLFHYGYWIVLMIAGHLIYPEDTLTFSIIPMINMFIVSLLVLIFSLFYYFATERSFEQLEYSNRQNEILLKEIHHRIKNNLNIIASILGLQIMDIRKGEREDPTEILLKSKLRIEAIAMVHEALYQSSDLGKIDFKPYVEHLSDAIEKTYNQVLPIEIRSKEIFLPLETMLKLGTIINELLTNTIKHTMQRGENLESIVITLKYRSGTCIFTYHEQGKGQVDINRLNSSKTLGMKLIRLTVKQMDAELEIYQKEGLLFSILFT